MRLFAEVGYHAATNAMIADAANLTRGAMLYHFASREELVEAAIAYIEVERARLFEQAASGPMAPGVDAAEHAIDAYWALLHEIPFIAFAELEAAARTDAMLRVRLAQSETEVPEISANKYALNVRFMLPETVARPRVAERDVAFELTFCSL